MDGTGLTTVSRCCLAIFALSDASLVFICAVLQVVLQEAAEQAQQLSMRVVAPMPAALHRSDARKPRTWGQSLPAFQYGMEL